MRFRYRGLRLENFSGRYIEWSSHALQRCSERGKSPAEVERMIRMSRLCEQRADGRYRVDGCVGGEVTSAVVAERGSDAAVIVTVYGRNVRCS